MATPSQNPPSEVDGAHRHNWVVHRGLRLFGGARIAWVRHDVLSGGEDLPWMWACVDCGEQGYEVKP